MKFQDRGNLQTSGQKRQIGVDPEALGKIVGLLSKHMYSNPASAFREAWLNARESHAKLGSILNPSDAAQGVLNTRSMEITFPHAPGYNRNLRNTSGINVVHSGGYTLMVDNDFSREFSIRDYGVGLSPEELEEMIGNAGKSDKTDDNTYGGGMGIGSLAGFSVSSQIIYTAYKDGIKSSMILSGDDNSLVPVQATETDEENGVMLTYILSDEVDSNRFSLNAAEFLRLAPLDESAVIRCSEDVAVHLQNRKGFTSKRGHVGLSFLPEASILSASGSINIRVDGCFYKGEYGSDMNDVLAKEIGTLLGQSVDHHSLKVDRIIWDVPVGYFQSISPSREVISLSKKDLKFFANLYVESVRDAIDLSIKRDFLSQFPKDQSINEELSQIADYIEADNAISEAVPRGYYHMPIKGKHDVLAEDVNLSGDFSIRTLSARLVGNGSALGIEPKATKSKHFSTSYRYGRESLIKLGISEGSGPERQDILHFRTSNDEVYTVGRDSGTAYLGCEFYASRQDVSDTTVYHVRSSSNTLNQSVWKERLSELASADLSTLSVEERDLVKTLTRDDVTILVSIPSTDSVFSDIKNMGIVVKPFDHEVDGARLRKIYTKVLGKKVAVNRKETSYRFLVSDDTLRSKIETDYGVKTKHVGTNIGSSKTFLIPPSKINEIVSDLGLTVYHDDEGLSRFHALTNATKGVGLELITRVCGTKSAVLGTAVGTQKVEKMLQSVDGEIKKLSSIKDEDIYKVLRPTQHGRLDAAGLNSLNQFTNSLNIDLSNVEGLDFLKKLTPKPVNNTSNGYRLNVNPEDYTLSTLMNCMDDDSLRESLVKDALGVSYDEADRVQRALIKVSSGVDVRNLRAFLSKQEVSDLVSGLIVKALA